MPQTTMQKLIGAASTRSIDLPLLNVIGPLFATTASKCLRKMLAASINISINRSGYARYGHYLDELPFPALLWSRMAALSKEYQRQKI